MKKIISIGFIVSLMVLMMSCNETKNPISENATPESTSQLNQLSLDKQSTATFSVTLINMAPATGPGASQVFSPPILATHTRSSYIFRKNRYASAELAQVAQDAVNGPMVALLNDSDDFYDVVEGTGVIFPGDSATFTITAKSGQTNISLVSMLVNTNDAFVGLNRLKLPKYGTTEVHLNTYDAGTEVNTELAAHIPGPCCGNPLVDVPENNKVSLHGGILGIGDLDPAVYGWTDPVAKLIITRIE